MNSLRLLPSALCLLIALALLGCTEEAVTVAPAVAEPVRVTGLTPNYVKSEQRGDASIVGPFIHQANVLFSHSDGSGITPSVLSQLDEKLDAHRIEVPSEYRYRIDQVASHRMLALLDLHCPSDCDALREKHITRLLDSEFPDARVLEQYIAQMNWPSDEVREARLKAALNAEQWLEQRGLSKTSPACGDSPVCEEIRTNGDEMSEEIAEAMARLRRS